MELHWKFTHFDELTTTELYAILRLRSEVFVVEQHCNYLDADGKDMESFHITGWKDNLPVAYCRVLPPGLSYAEASIGRVITSAGYRNFGYGRQLINLAVAFTLKQFEVKKITIGAQVYLKKFYESFGFAQISDIYLEDQIPHIKMQLTL